ncbi:MAG: response regulator [Planctomycetota bacterium]
MSKVLIADDSSVLRRIMMRVLREADPELDEFVEASTGDEALVRFERQPDIALVVCDVDMPGLDGWAVSRALRARRASGELAIVLVAKHGDASAAQRAAASGANACVTKPFTADSIRALVARG